MKRDSQPQSGESLKESNPKMKEILITTPAELVGVSEKGDNFAIIRFGYLFRLPEDILDKISKLVPLVKEKLFYIIFEVKFKGEIDYISGRIEKIQTYPFYREDFPISGAGLLMSISKDDASKLSWVYSHSLYKSPTIWRFGMKWKTMEVWNFNAVILRQTKETPEDLKYVGIGLLSMFRKATKPEMVDLWV